MPKMMSPARASEYLGLKERQLRNLRNAGKGPKFKMIGAQTYMYSRDDLDEWVDSLTVEPGGDDDDI